MEERTATFSSPSFTEFNLPGGTIINQRYRIEEKIGCGGCGMVFKATDTLLKSTLALKFLNPTLINDKKKFHRVTREINLLRKVADPHIIKIFSLEKWQEYYFLVMEFIIGKSIKQLFAERKQFLWKEFQPVYLEILAGIRVLHRHNIIHRDIKPSNILITNENKVVIIDFGLAKEISDREKTSSLGEVVGTPFYMAPEQAIIGGIVDFRSDIYSLGMILYRALTGKHPFAGMPTMDVIFKQVYTKPAKVLSKHKEFPRFIRYTLEKALEKKKTRRFQSIDEMLRFLDTRKTGIFNYISAILFFKPLRLAGFVLSIALLIGIIFTLKSAIQNIHSLDKKGSIARARNLLGKQLWAHDFTPYTIRDIYREKVKTSTQNAGLKIYPQAVIVFLEHPRNRIFSPEVSLQSLELDNRIAYLDNQGREIFNKSIIETTGMRTDDFARISEIETIQEKDLDFDDKNELILIIRHSRGMYPTALCILDQGNLYTFLNPGAIDYYSPLPGDEKNNLCLVLLGFKNTLSHLCFFAEINLPKGQNFTLREFPGTQHLNFKWGQGIEYFALLPRGSVIINSYKDTWQEQGTLGFVDFRSQKKIYLHRDYSFTRKGKSYEEKPENLEEIYTSINRFFQARDVEGDQGKALSLIEDSLKTPVINPYLKSALLYLKGDIEVTMGRYQAGEQTLRQAIQQNSGNADAAHRICEIYFLKGGIQKAIHSVDSEFSHLKNFWGLGSGNLLFKSYCYMQSGDFSKAESLFPQIVDKSHRQSINCFKGMVNLFKGEYKEAVNNFKGFEDHFVYNLSVLELRLLISRARILAGMELEQAKFYLEDIISFSQNRKHLAVLSLAYLLAGKGKLLHAEEMALAGFQTVKRKSESDFETRLWFFYDAYLFGRIMEICGRKDKAMHGFKECIKANPNTHLAQISNETFK